MAFLRAVIIFQTPISSVCFHSKLSVSYTSFLFQTIAGAPDAVVSLPMLVKAARIRLVFDKIQLLRPAATGLDFPQDFQWSASVVFRKLMWKFHEWNLNFGAHAIIDDCLDMNRQHLWLPQCHHWWTMSLFEIEIQHTYAGLPYVKWSAIEYWLVGVFLETDFTAL